MAQAKSPIPEGFHSVTPHLIFDDAAKAIDWYKKALGADEKSRALGPDGKMMHAELQIGNSRFMLNDVMGEGKSPKTLGGSPISLWIYGPTATRCSRAPLMRARTFRPARWARWPISSGAIAAAALVDPFGYQWNDRHAERRPDADGDGPPRGRVLQAVRIAGSHA